MLALIKKYQSWFWSAAGFMALFLIYFVGRSYLDLSVNFISAAIILIILLAILLVIFMVNPKTGILFLVFSLPFERIPTLEISGYTLKINQIIIMVLALAFLGHLAVKKDFKIAANPLLPGLLLFLAAAALSFLNSQVLSRSILIFSLFVFMALVFFLTPNLIKNTRDINSIIKILTTVTILLCLFGIFQFLGDRWGFSQSLTGLRDAYTKHVLGFTRIQATLLEPLYLANFLIIPLCLFAALFLSNQIKTKWYWLALFFILVLTVFILTIARSGYLGLAAGLLVIILFRVKSYFSLKKQIFVVIVLVFTGLACLGLLGNSYKLFLAHGQAPLQGDEEASSAERKMTIKKGLAAYLSQPILGIGLGNYGPYFANYPSKMPASGWQTVNNQYVEILAEMGLVGAVFFGIFLLAILARSWLAFWQTKDQFLSAVLLGLTAALVGILVQFYFFSTLYIVYIWFLLGLLVAIQEMIFRKKGRDDKSIDKKSVDEKSLPAN